MPQASFGDISTFNGLMRACTIKNESAHAQHHFTTRNMIAQTHTCASHVDCIERNDKRLCSVTELISSFETLHT